MSDAIPDDIETLVSELLPWAGKMPSITFYIYGSRVRGDHRPDSDVDIFFDTDCATWGDLVEVQDRDGFPEKYKCLYDQSQESPELRAMIRLAPVRYRSGNITCVLMPRTIKP